jgi:hypothetical protein
VPQKQVSSTWIPIPDALTFGTLFNQPAEGISEFPQLMPEAYLDLIALARRSKTNQRTSVSCLLLTIQAVSSAADQIAHCLSHCHHTSSMQKETTVPACFPCPANYWQRKRSMISATCMHQLSTTCPLTASNQILILRTLNPRSSIHLSPPVSSRLHPCGYCS